MDLCSKYFSTLADLEILPNNINIEQLINKAIDNINDYVFYDNNDKELLKKLGIGKKNKGLAKNSILYVNKNQTDEMVEITFYHELTHLLQNHSDTINSEDIGVMKNWKYRLLMEAQTQYLAELIYSKVHGKERQEIYQNTEELRMIPGGKVKSNLRNYELYDCILSKMCLFLNIDKKDFVKLNFMGKNAPELLTKKVVDLYGEDVCNFVWESLDLIYSTDVIIYGSDNGELLPDKCNVRSRVDDRIMNASSKNQMKTINNLDELLYLEMVNKFSYDLNKFIPYIISNEKREERLPLPESE